MPEDEAADDGEPDEERYDPVFVLTVEDDTSYPPAVMAIWSVRLSGQWFWRKLHMGPSRFPPDPGLRFRGREERVDMFLSYPVMATPSPRWTSRRIIRFLRTWATVL